MRLAEVVVHAGAPAGKHISQEARQLFARIVGSELLVHARASVVKHIRQEAEATFCVDSWLRAFRACECPFRKTYQARSSMRVPLW